MTKKLDTKTIKKGYKNNTYALRNKIIFDKKTYQLLLSKDPNNEIYKAVLEEILEIEKVCITRGRY